MLCYKGLEISYRLYGWDGDIFNFVICHVVNNGLSFFRLDVDGKYRDNE